MALAFLGCFTLALLLPLLQTLYPIFGTVAAPLEERRVPRPFPSPLLLLETTGKFAAALNNWFDDRVGFRDLFIRTKNQIDYTFFGRRRKFISDPTDGCFFVARVMPSSNSTTTAYRRLRKAMRSLPSGCAKRASV